MTFQDVCHRCGGGAAWDTYTPRIFVEIVNFVAIVKFGTIQRRLWRHCEYKYSVFSFVLVLCFLPNKSLSRLLQSWPLREDDTHKSRSVNNQIWLNVWPTTLYIYIWILTPKMPTKGCNKRRTNPPNMKNNIPQMKATIP